MKKTLANKLIDKKIDGYINQNRKHSESGSQRVSILGRYFKRQHNNHHKGISKAVEERWLYDNAAQADT